MDEKNNDINHFIIGKFGFLGSDFLLEAKSVCKIINVIKKEEIIREGDCIKYVWFVIKGNIKVYSVNDARELTYFYVGDNENCLIIFSSIFNDSFSRVYAVAEKDSEVLLIPISVMSGWLTKFPEISRLFFHEYEQRFNAVMDMVNEVVFHKLDTRILNYIKHKLIREGKEQLKIKHREIAGSLGTSREVVTRVMKKIENDKKIFKDRNGYLYFK